jgi:TRAP-type C4-dicarboxylate transport system permease small subunit
MQQADGGAMPRRPSGAWAVLHRIIRAWAIYVGGTILIGLVVMITVSAILNLITRRPIPGDYELTKHFMAVAIAAFLPYCQLSGANITVDIFTERASDRTKAVMALIAALLALAFSLIMLRQTWLGLLDYRRLVEVTGILGIPLWTAFPPMLVSIALWVVASWMTVVSAFRSVRTGTVAAS